MAEWFKAHAWRACIGETLSWVRIPLSPPLIFYEQFYCLENINLSLIIY
jgi:hypothetical protein